MIDDDRCDTCGTELDRHGCPQCDRAFDFDPYEPERTEIIVATGERL